MSDKIVTLLKRAGLPAVVKKNDLVAIKLHFGERGNTAFIRPLFIKDIIGAVAELGGSPFLTDTNTLYCGERTDAVAHTALAIEHGFNYTALRAPVIIADGLRGADETVLAGAGGHFTRLHIGAAIMQADAIVCVSHFKGHELSGFGGALKNLGMGCASRAGKLQQHTGISPGVDAGACTGCGRCIDECPAAAIGLVKKKAVIDPSRCIGCAKCISRCPQHAIDISWNEDARLFQEKMVEYAWGIMRNKRKRLLFVNFLTDISPQCDCYGHADRPIVPDIGILASADPVALDLASADLVNAQAGIKNSALAKHFKPRQDKFRALYPAVDWKVQLACAERLGMGSTTYTMVHL